MNKTNVNSKILQDTKSIYFIYLYFLTATKKFKQLKTIPAAYSCRI